jgi:hypothetical protein
MLPLLWMRRWITSQGTFRGQGHGRRAWSITLLILGLCTTRTWYVLLLIAVTFLLCFVGVLPRLLTEIFTPITFVTRIISIEPFGKNV